jgi:ankyrin repeat protein
MTLLTTNKWFNAAIHNNTVVMQELLDQVGIEQFNEEGCNALHLASMHNATHVAQLLLSHKANIEAQEKVSNCTPLLLASSSGHVEITLILLQAGANIYAQDNYEWSILHWIASEDHLRLFDAIYSVNSTILSSLTVVKRWNGIGPLHMVNSPDMAKRLILIGASIDEQTVDGDTPLFEAIVQNYIDVVLFFLKQHANMLHVNDKNETALDVADVMKHSQLKEVFTTALTKQNQKDRKKTRYIDNKTASLQIRPYNTNENSRSLEAYNLALSLISKYHKAYSSNLMIEAMRIAQCYYAGKHWDLDIRLIEYHASTRMDLLFFTMIAYYRSNLTVKSAKTNRQHGQSTGEYRACHSALLPALYDTQKTYTAPYYNLRRAAPAVSYYNTSIFDGTHFEDALNATVELHCSVNYFDSYYIENTMRDVALRILNQVSSGALNPIQGMNAFLNAFHQHFTSIEHAYYNKQELQTSPQSTRFLIHAAQYKGTFFNTCGIEQSSDNSTNLQLKDDYIQAQLPLSKAKRVDFQDKRRFFSTQEKETIYQSAYLQTKQDMDLPVAYQHI